jgi:hypothetical protein
MDRVGPEDHIEIRAHEGVDPMFGDDYFFRNWRDTGMYVGDNTAWCFDRTKVRATSSVKSDIIYLLPLT